MKIEDLKAILAGDRKMTQPEQMDFIDLCGEYFDTLPEPENPIDIEEFVKRLRASIDKQKKPEPTK